MDIRSLYHHKMFFNNKNHISFCANRSENCTKRFEKGLHFVLGLIYGASLKAKGLIPNGNRPLIFVGVAGFEPTTPCSQSRCANRTALHPELIYSKQLLKIFFFVGVAGFEPTTPCSQSRCANRTALHPERSFLQKRCKGKAYC